MIYEAYVVTCGVVSEVRAVSCSAENDLDDGASRDIYVTLSLH